MSQSHRSLVANSLRSVSHFLRWCAAWLLALVVAGSAHATITAGTIDFGSGNTELEPIGVLNGIDFGGEPDGWIYANIVCSGCGGAGNGAYPAAGGDSEPATAYFQAASPGDRFNVTGVKIRNTGANTKITVVGYRDNAETDTQELTTTPLDLSALRSFALNLVNVDKVRFTSSHDWHFAIDDLEVAPYASPPTITTLAPTSGPEAGGTSVVITGTQLTGATAVSFGATPATGFTVDSATQITATAPAGSGTVNVTVTTPGGTSATGPADQYVYQMLSSNADLSDLILSHATLTPTFSTGTLTYGAAVEHAINQLTVTPSAADTGATVTVNGVQVPPGTASAPITLNVGDNIITVQVTAADGTTQKTYVVTANRAPQQTVIAPPGTPGTGVTMGIQNSNPTCTLTHTEFNATSAAGTAPPAGYLYPYGMIDFVAKQCDNGSTLTVTLTFPNPLPANAVLMKYDASATPPWQPFIPTISGNQAIYTVIDGGLRDADALQNGEFVDPVALALPLEEDVTAIPTLDRWGMLLLALVAMLLGMQAMRHKTLP